MYTWVSHIISNLTYIITCTCVSLALLCTKSSGLRMDQLTEEAKELEEEYKAQRRRIDNLMADIKGNENYLEKKQQELENLNLAYSNARQKKVQRDLTGVNDHLRELQQKIAAIEQCILDSKKKRTQLITCIVEAQRQLEDTQKHIEKCLKSLHDEIEHLKFEKTMKLQECDHKSAPRTQPVSQQAGQGPGLVRLAAATTVAGVTVGTGSLLGMAALAAATGWLYYMSYTMGDCSILISYRIYVQGLITTRCY